jgi:uncharacterized protein YecE (DUF72 family)
MKKLADVDVPLANFFASGVLSLGDQLGPVLWQLPPTMGFDAQRLAGFFELCRGPRATRPGWQPITTTGSMGALSPRPTLTARFGMR